VGKNEKRLGISSEGSSRCVIPSELFVQRLVQLTKRILEDEGRCRREDVSMEFVNVNE